MGETYAKRRQSRDNGGDVGEGETKYSIANGGDICEGKSRDNESATKESEIEGKRQLKSHGSCRKKEGQTRVVVGRQRMRHSKSKERKRK
jgi:hypothetical protein